MSTLKWKQLFNSFFSNIVKKPQDSSVLKFSSYYTKYWRSNLKAVVKYKHHPSILTIQTKYKGKNKFSFTEELHKTLKKKFLI